MLVFYVFLIIILLPLTSGQGKGKIDYPRCFSLYGDHGESVSCPGDHVAIGSCGIGKEPICPKKTHFQMTCCPITDYTPPTDCDQRMEMHVGNKGDWRQCTGNKIVQAACGSGNRLACGPYSYKLWCQTDCRVTVDTKSCEWIGALQHGEQIDCKEDHVLTGRCGSKKREDCKLGGKKYSMLIKCCRLKH